MDVSRKRLLVSSLAALFLVAVVFQFARAGQIDAPSPEERVIGQAVERAKFLASIFSQTAKVDDQTYTVTVSGEGEVTAVPDEAHIYCAVEAFSEKASEAVRLQAGKTEKFLNLLRDALKKRELDSKDVATLGYAHQSIYKRVNDESVLTGYKVSQSFRVQTSVSQVGTTLDKITEEALVQQVEFTVSNVDALEEQAVNLAIEHAK